jgi:pimeloyl-ACP methyl ester carboxylesterase
MIARKTFTSFFSFVSLISLLLAACVSPAVQPTATTAPPTNTSAPPTATSVPPTATEVPPTETPQPSPTPEPSATPDVLPPEPVRIEFTSGDGTPLVGYYYPAAVENAPVVVLMHWVGGSNCDWLAVNLVQWLQNRATVEGLAANAACQNAEVFITAPLDLYPPLPEGQSFAVFAFDLRGHGENGGSINAFDSAGWLQDSMAGVQIARTLEGVDPARVAAIGASIGADGAIDGCGEGCLGALSLSPGNYYGIPYKTAVDTLGEDQRPAWCVAATGDGEAFPTCDSPTGDHYQKIIFEGESAHAMAMFDPDFEFKAELRQTILDFVSLVFGS